MLQPNRRHQNAGSMNPERGVAASRSRRAIRLAFNPFRSEGKSYFEIGLLGEIVLGRYRLFLNLENLLNLRQTREDPLVRPTRAPVGRWTVFAGKFADAYRPRVAPSSRSNSSLISW